MKKVIVKNNIVVGVEENEFPIASSHGEWKDCSTDTVNVGDTYNADGTATPEFAYVSFDELNWKKKRQIKYKEDLGGITGQLDEIYHNGIDSWKAKVKAVKDKYPKEE